MREASGHPHSPYKRIGPIAAIVILSLATLPRVLCAHTGPAPVVFQPPAPLIAPAIPAAETPATTPAEIANANDFSDTDFAQADQPELGNRAGASSRSDDLWFFLFFYYLFFIFLAPFDYSPHHHGGGCAPSHHSGGGGHHSGGGHGH